MELKKRLARLLVGWLHGQEAAARAEEEFERVFQQRQAPEEVPTFVLEQEMPLATILSTAGLAPSTSEARRLIRQGAVELDGRRLTDPWTTLGPEALPSQGSLLRVGKRRFLRLRPA